MKIEIGMTALLFFIILFNILKIGPFIAKKSIQRSYSLEKTKLFVWFFLVSLIIILILITTIILLLLFHII